MTKINTTMLLNGEETIGWRNWVQMQELLYERKSQFQDIKVFRHQLFGQALVLDDYIQTSEADECIYNETITLVPMVAHGNPERVLIIGGGDGGALKAALLCPAVKQVTMVEIDGDVIDVCKKYMPSIPGQAYDDPRTTLLVDDGAKFVAETSEQFDVIVVDGCDPVGPAKVLFSPEFFRNCKRIMRAGGIITTQACEAFFVPEGVRETIRGMKGLWQDQSFMAAAVPGYLSGVIAFGWASDNIAARRLSRDEIAARLAAWKLQARHYNADMHMAAFALPFYMRELIAGEQGTKAAA